VIIDVAIDQGGCIAVSHPTSHENPIFEHEGKIFSCIPNLPGQFPHQATRALTNATLPYILNLAQKGVIQALKEDKLFARGLNVFEGSVAYEEVAKALDLPYKVPSL
jgi:alanine dehydrogenase